jgi:hypothetical protein
MTDIAVDATGTVWGISAEYVHQIAIKGSVAHCTSMPALPSTPMGLAGLSFVPVGAIDATAEVLVATGASGELWAIDSGGQATQHGSFGTIPNDDIRRSLPRVPKTW